MKSRSSTAYGAENSTLNPADSRICPVFSPTQNTFDVLKSLDFGFDRKLATAFLLVKIRLPDTSEMSNGVDDVLTKSASMTENPALSRNCFWLGSSFFVERILMALI